MRVILVAAGLAALLAASQFALRAFGPPDGGLLSERARPVARAVAAPDVALTDLRGGKARLSGRGETTVAMLWATWCSICKRDLPKFAALAEEMAAAPVTFLAVAIDEPATAEGVASDLAALAPGLAPLHEGTGALAAAIGLNGTPTTLVIDRFGQVVAFIVGPGPWADPATADWLEALAEAKSPEAARGLLTGPDFARR